MRQLLVLSLFFLGPVAAAQASNNKGKIEGTRWSSVAGPVTIQKTGQTVNLPAGALKLEFRKDGSMVYNAGPQTFTGRYTLGDGDKVTFHLDQPLAGNKTHQETIVITGGRMTVTDSDGTSLAFNKVE